MVNELSEFAQHLFHPAMVAGDPAWRRCQLLLGNLRDNDVWGRRHPRALLTAPLVDRAGVERVLTCVLAFGALCVLSIGMFDPPFWALSVGICGAGVGIGGCQAGINSLSGSIYPAAIRSTGAGWAQGA